MTQTTDATRVARGPVDHQVRDQIVAAATDHFGRYGYAKTTVSDLATAIGFSKAYVYKFFESKQAIGAVICANCLGGIESEVVTAVAEADSPPEKLRQMFTAGVDATLALFTQNPRLYEIAADGVAEGWPAIGAYQDRWLARIQEVLTEGRQSGDFERETPLEESARSIYLVMLPYLNPLLLQHGLNEAHEAPALLSNLVLRGLVP